MLTLLLLFACQRVSDIRPDLSTAATAALLLYAEHSPPDPKAFLRLILDGQFEAFEAQARAHKQGWEQVPAREVAYQHLFEVPQSDAPGLTPRLDDWIVQRPSHISCGARGSYDMGLGERDLARAVRGHGGTA